MKIAISAESSADLTEELKEKYDIKIVPLQVLLGDKNYLDGEVTADDIIKFVDENKILPKTGATNEYQFEEHFSSLLKEYDAVIHFSISGEMSSAYSNAVKVSKKMKNVYVVDTKILSTGISLLAIYARKLADKGLEAEEIYNKCLKRVPFIKVTFVLERLDYLYKGGRCNALSYFGANLLRIRPQIIVKDGKMISGKKYMGSFPKVVKKYLNDALTDNDNPDLSLAFFTYTTATSEVKDSVINFLKDKGFNEILVTRAGGAITSHCGENCLGILYINDGGDD